ncbi:MAG: hypothetical protein RL017_569, partial [Pseudomonadota bacterium]
ICAMQEELDAVLDSFKKSYETIKIKNFTYYKFIHNKFIVYLVLSGIGKVNAALVTQFMVDRILPEYVFNIGVAGCLVDNLKFGDIVIASSLVQHDVNVAAFDLPLGQIPRMDVFDFKPNEYLLSIAAKIKQQIPNINIGRIVSGDQFIDDRATAEFLRTQFSALACEMEGAAIAHVCYFNDIPCLVIRSLSDLSGLENNANHSFLELKQMASDHAAKVAPILLAHL